MKYGKEFQQILDDPSLPPEWKASAIQYGRLKKIIKDVVAELSAMGLSPQVLHKLLEPESIRAAAQGSSQAAAVNAPSIKDQRSDSNTSTDGGDILEFEFESPDGSPETLFQKATKPKTSPQEATIDPVLDEEADDEHGSIAGTSVEHHGHKTFRLRLLSESKPQGPVVPMGVMDMVKTRTEQRRRSSATSNAGSTRSRKPPRKAVLDDQGGVKAEYVLVGDADHPTPQLRLHLSSTPTTRSTTRSVSSSSASASRSHSLSASRSVSASRSHSTATDSASDSFPSDNEHAIVSASESEDETDSDAAVTRALTSSPRISSPRTPRAFGQLTTPRAIPAIDILPPSPSFQRLQKAISPIWALASGTNVADGLSNLTLEEAMTPTAELPEPSLARQSTIKQSSSSSSPKTERDFIIPLASDVVFFNLLTAALGQLSEFHAQQQEAFRKSVEQLCAMISSTIQPGASPTVVAMPFTPSPADDSVASGPSTSTALIRSKGSKFTPSKKDLYAWREIFTLWIEHEIFESSAERDRGERTVEQAQARLQTFANEVIKRGLGDRRTMKGKKVRGAWDEFLRLNVLLLDLKRFQLANINAARKILKKHDKRTALTASAGFPSFVRSTLAASFGATGEAHTWQFYNTSLPHVLLASLTDTLLPILPSLDDYACLICTSIAFKPIRLGCGHLFCVRCLVKMQRAGKAECPLCRSKVVLLANKDSLDIQLMQFMKEWFPKEVKMKQKENEGEVSKEQIRDAGLDPRCVIM